MEEFGGMFNNIVTLFCLGALTTLVMHAVGRRGGSDAPLLRLGERFIALAVASGVLGTLFNLIEMSAALATVSEELATQASNRAMGIVPIPLVWSLLCAIPLWLATGCMRYRATSAA